jgi:hypothetical protein
MKIKAGIFTRFIGQPDYFMPGILVDPFGGHLFSAGFQEGLGVRDMTDEECC